jgi:hypothetical protein
MSRAVIDERGFAMVRRIREANSDVPLSTFKAKLREQFYMLLIDAERSLTAIPSMLPEDPGLRQRAFELIVQVLSARVELSAEDRQRLQHVAELFGVGERLSGTKSVAIGSQKKISAGTKVS